MGKKTDTFKKSAQYWADGWWGGILAGINYAVTTLIRAARTIQKRRARLITRIGPSCARPSELHRAVVNDDVSCPEYKRPGLLRLTRALFSSVVLHVWRRADYNYSPRSSSSPFADRKRKTAATIVEGLVDVLATYLGVLLAFPGVYRPFVRRTIRSDVRAAPFGNLFSIRFGF